MGNFSERQWGISVSAISGATHHQALRALANRLVGILHGCLRHHTLYDEHTAWAGQQEHVKTLAA